MAKRVILAVAGAGKTYHICHEIDPTKRNLILAFTHENIYNIQKELCDAHGCVPELTTVSTFDSFVYHQLVLPYEPSIAEHFGCPKFVCRKYHQGRVYCRCIDTCKIPSMFDRYM